MKEAPVQSILKRSVDMAKTVDDKLKGLGLIDLN